MVIAEVLIGSVSYSIDVWSNGPSRPDQPISPCVLYTVRYTLHCVITGVHIPQLHISQAAGTGSLLLIYPQHMPAVKTVLFTTALIAVSTGECIK